METRRGQVGGMDITCSHGWTPRNASTEGADGRSATPAISLPSVIARHLVGTTAALAGTFVAAVHFWVRGAVTGIRASGRQRGNSPQEAEELVEHQGRFLWLLEFPFG